MPSVSTFSRVFKKIVEKNLVEQIFYDLVQQCRLEDIIIGDILAIDSTGVDAYEKKQPRSRCQDTGNASWGAKFDSYGNKITWFAHWNTPLFHGL